jgi:hypothetical protein
MIVDDEHEILGLLLHDNLGLIVYIYEMIYVNKTSKPNLFI